MEEDEKVDCAFIPVRGEIYHSTISSTDCLCGGGTSDSKHV